jgi:hypothetical protein
MITRDKTLSQLLKPTERKINKRIPYLSRLQLKVIVQQLTAYRRDHSGMMLVPLPHRWIKHHYLMTRGHWSWQLQHSLAQSQAQT